MSELRKANTAFIKASGEAVDKTLSDMAKALEEDLTELYRLRAPLIERRNKILTRPFYSFRKKLRLELETIDRELDRIEREFYQERDQADGGPPEGPASLPRIPCIS